MKQLILTEKPSVAKAIAAALGVKGHKDGYIENETTVVSWCIGHLLGLAAADAYDARFKSWRYGDLPILPANWEHTAAKDKAKQLATLVKLLNREDISSVVNACDAGREGELIFRLVYEHAGCKKPIQRLWISSMENCAIRQGMDALRPGAEYDSLYAAALCREKADWLVGINATRLFSVLYRNTLNVGRVQSPTLALLVEREAKIAAFVKEPFYTVELAMDGYAATSEKFKSKEDAKGIVAGCDGQAASVVSVESVEKTTAPPKLYDLTTLQREANRHFGYTAQQTLDYIQALYDKKLATYPRTDSRYLTEDMAGSLGVLVNQAALMVPGVRGTAAIMLNVEQVINNAKVSDHHAIIPTMSIRDADLDSLPTGEKNILHLVALRLVCAVGDKHRYTETVATLECGGETFIAKGKIVVAQGWKAVEQAHMAGLKLDADAEPAKENNATLPPISEGAAVHPVSATLKEGFTTPPKRFTEDRLLAAMETAGAEEAPEDVERKGLGTPATRASIIEKLVKTQLAERKKKLLVPTEKGTNLIALLPESVKSPLLTAEWEYKLKQVERGELPATDFMTAIADYTSELVQAYSAPLPQYQALFAPPKAEPVGVCPRCGSAVVENSKGFFCESHACAFGIWKDNRFFKNKKKAVTKSMVAALLKDGRVAVKGLYSEKKGKTYDAVVVLEDTGGKYVNFKLDFPKKTKANA